MSIFDKIKHYKALKNGLKEGSNVTIMGGKFWIRTIFD